MPTWRETKIGLFNWKTWEDQLKEKFVVLVRSHHFDNTKYENTNFIIDVTEYEDVNKLYLLADILISDYSSAFFDYGLLGKPMLCYAPDYDEYCKNPGLFMDLRKEFPGGIKQKESDIVDSLLSMDYLASSSQATEYVHKYVNHPVNATNSCLKRLRELLGVVNE